MISAVFWSIIGVWLSALILKICLEKLNCRYMERNIDKIPQNYSIWLDPWRMKRSSDYLKARSSAGILEMIFTNSADILFIFLLLELYASWILNNSLPPLLTGIMFFLIPVFASSIIEIPFELYRTFVIETRFGFNNMSAGLWLRDWIKSNIVGLFLSGILVCGLLLIIHLMPDCWWLLCWGLFWLFIFTIFVIGPTMILPLFNSFSPLEDESLLLSLKAVLEKSGLNISSVFVMDASLRTKHANAFFTGAGKDKRIVIFDTLLKELDHSEIAAVLAHEAGHWKKRHLLKHLLLFTTLSLPLFFVVYLGVKYGFFAAVFGLHPSGNAVLPLNLFLAAFVLKCGFIPAAAIFNFMARRFEYEADRYAVELCGSPDGLCTALLKLTRGNLANLFPHPLYVFFFYSHPPLMERLAAVSYEPPVQETDSCVSDDYEPDYHERYYDYGNPEDQC